MSERAGSNSAQLVLLGLWHVSQPPWHLFAIVVQKPDDGLEECPVLAVRRASALVRVDPAEMVYCDIGEGLGSICVHLGHHRSMMFL